MLIQQLGKLAETWKFSSNLWIDIPYSLVLAQSWYSFDRCSRLLELIVVCWLVTWSGEWVDNRGHDISYYICKHHVSLCTYQVNIIIMSLKSQYDKHRCMLEFGAFRDNNSRNIRGIICLLIHFMFPPFSIFTLNLFSIFWCIYCKCLATLINQRRMLYKSYI
jgi:hypothetical protein